MAPSCMCILLQQFATICNVYGIFSFRESRSGFSVLLYTTSDTPAEWQRWKLLILREI